MRKQLQQLSPAARHELFRAALRGLLAALFVAAGVTKFLDPPLFLSMMPPALPNPEILLNVVAICHLLGGLMVLVPPTRKVGGVILCTMLLATFPANVHMALAGWGDVPNWIWWARLPFQLLFFAWVWFVALSPNAQLSLSARVPARR